MARFNDTTINGNLSVSGRVTATSFNATSDRRLKTNIETYTLSKSVLDLNVYEYDFIHNGEHAIGCMADELKEICPELVTTSNDGTMMINEVKIVYLLLDEIKSLSKRVAELEASIVK